MKKLNCTDSIQINKAVLTPELIRCLESLQADDNFGLHAIRDDLANAVCFLGRCIPQLDDDYHEEINHIIAALSQARKTIKEFETPKIKN